jgi:hypothetical protein
MKGASLEQAREAKKAVLGRLGGLPGIRGVGLTECEGGYAVKVNVAAWALALELGSDVNGVPVIINVVGPASGL